MKKVFGVLFLLSAVFLLPTEVKAEKTSISFAYGDVDMNGIIDNRDAEIIVSRSVGLNNINSNQLLLADVDHSGNISSIDAQKVFDFYEGRIENYEYVNIEQLKDAWSLTYKIGDLNLDGKVDTEDLTKLDSYIGSIVETSTNEKLTNSRVLKLVDANQDGIISLVDYNMLKSGNINKEITFTDSNIIVTTSEYILGDTDLDGTITENDASIIEQYYVGKTLTPFELAICDVNGDALCNSEDVTLIRDQNYKRRKIIVLIENNPFERKEYLYGDLDLDGYITYNDKKLLNMYINNPKKSNGIIKEYLLADIDKNGKVDTDDLIRIENILKHISGTTINKTDAIYAGKVENKNPNDSEITKPEEDNKVEENKENLNNSINNSNGEIENPNTSADNYLLIILLCVLGIIIASNIFINRKQKFFKI